MAIETSEAKMAATLVAEERGHPSAVDALLDGPVMKAEYVVDEMEARVAAEDWEALPALATALRQTLQQLDFEMLSRGGAQSREGLETLAARLHEVERRHGVLIVALTEARDRTAEELSAVVDGHHGANQYLLAAGGA